MKIKSQKGGVKVLVGILIVLILAAGALLAVKYLKGDKTGAFITLGDPSVYSTFMYTLPYIEAFGTSGAVILWVSTPPNF